MTSYEVCVHVYYIVKFMTSSTNSFRVDRHGTSEVYPGPLPQSGGWSPEGSSIADNDAAFGRVQVYDVKLQSMYDV